MEEGAQKQEKQNKKVGRRLLSQNLRLVQRIQLAAAGKQSGGVCERGRDEVAAKNADYDISDEENLRSKGRMDAENKWWVTELLAADCEKSSSSAAPSPGPCTCFCPLPSILHQPSAVSRFRRPPSFLSSSFSSFSPPLRPFRHCRGQDHPRAVFFCHQSPFPPS